MSTASIASAVQHEPELLGRTVVVIGGSSGTRLETARRARAEGQRSFLPHVNPERLEHAATEIDALNSAAFDMTNSALTGATYDIDGGQQFVAA